MSVIINEGAPKEFADLPPEVVSTILGYLPYPDLKSSRLVNKLCYEASLAFSILDTEVFRYPYCDDFRETFEKSRRDFLHIKVIEGDQKIWFSDWFWAKVKPNVRSLWLEKSDISQMELFMLLENCPMLNSLWFKSCDFSSEDPSAAPSDLSSLKLSRLKTLNLVYGPCDDIDVFFKIAGCAPNLELLGLSETLNPGKTATLSLIQHAATFLERNPHRHLSLSLNFKLQRSDRAYMLKLASRGEAVQFEGMEMNGVVENWNPSLFEHFSSLQRLDITTGVTDEALDVICGELRTLKQLSLYDCSMVVNGVEKLSSLTNLQTLILWKCIKVSKESILTGLCSRVDKILKTFAFCGLREIPDSCFVELARCHPSVTDLDFQKCSIRSDGVKAISFFQPLVNKLLLGECYHIDDEVLTPLSLLKDLKLLEIQYTKVKGGPFEEGLTMPVLQSICLNFTQVSIKSVRCLIENHKTLLDLWFWGRPFSKVHVEDLLSTRPHLRCNP